MKPVQEVKQKRGLFRKSSCCVCTPLGTRIFRAIFQLGLIIVTDNSGSDTPVSGASL